MKQGAHRLPEGRRPPNLDRETELALRDEIRTTQGSQADLLKWKLIAVAAVGSMSLGLPEVVTSSAGSSELRYQLLCLIPPICLYADLICLHYMLRIITLGAFIKKSHEKTGQPLHDYEGFVFTTRVKYDPFNLEVWAITGSSRFINLLLLVISGALLMARWPWTWSMDLLTPFLFGLFSFLGLAGTHWMRRQYKSSFDCITDTEITRDAARDGAEKPSARTLLPDGGAG